MPSKPTPARALAAALLLALAVPALRTSTVMPALHAFLNAAVALPLGVGKLASLGSFALQVLVDGNTAPVDGREGRLLAHVLAHSRPGDLEGALAASIDYQSSAEFFMSVGTDKGKVSRSFGGGGLGRAFGHKFVSCVFRTGGMGAGWAQ